jgi:hypothetical protein
MMYLECLAEVAFDECKVMKLCFERAVFDEIPEFLVSDLTQLIDQNVLDLLVPF